jgi:hypothetical protein
LQSGWFLFLSLLLNRCKITIHFISEAYDSQ